MLFTLTHNAQSHPIDPVKLQVEPSARKDYPLKCQCKFVFLVAQESVAALVERRLVLEGQQTDKTYVCGCLGVLEGRPEPRLPVLARSLAIIDLETTDPEPTTAAIFEFGVTVITSDGKRSRWSQRFRPWKPITPGAGEVTGVDNIDVDNCPPFSAFAEKIVAGLKGKDLAGFNIKSFDAVCLDEELRRCGLKLDTEGVTILDVFHIFQRKDPRNLTAAVRKYCGRDHEDAHGAQADCDATADVMQAMLGKYEDLSGMSLAEMDKFSLRDPEQPAVDFAGKFYRDADGDLRYTMAKVRDVKVREDVGFGMWMRKQTSPPFPGNTLDVLDAELRRIGAL